jgi:hypothetical protein
MVHLTGRAYCRLAAAVWMAVVVPLLVLGEEPVVVAVAPAAIVAGCALAGWMLP